MSGVRRVSSIRWRWVERNFPIACVDLLPVRLHEDAEQIGLIFRDTPHQNRRWCLIGGRVNRGERLSEAALRLWRDALGDSLPFESFIRPEPRVVEYLPRSREPGQPHDPRKHAIANTYLVRTSGSGRAHGTEALDFRWFSPTSIDSLAIGFGQEGVIRSLLPLLSRPTA